MAGQVVGFGPDMPELLPLAVAPVDTVSPVMPDLGLVPKMHQRLEDRFADGDDGRLRKLVNLLFKQRKPVIGEIFQDIGLLHLGGRFDEMILIKVGGVDIGIELDLQAHADFCQVTPDRLVPVEIEHDTDTLSAFRAFYRGVLADNDQLDLSGALEYAGDWQALIDEIPQMQILIDS